MNTPTLETIDIVCINLDSRTDRWENMQRRLAAYGLTHNLTRKSACTPDQLNRQYESYLPSGAKACAQSHLEVWEAFLSSNKDVIMILEDDIQFRKDWVSIVNEKLATISVEDPEWHALFLNGTEELPVQEKWALAHEQYMTGAILYSRRGIQKLLDMYGPPYHASDWMTMNLQYSGHSYTYFPWLTVQEGSYSDIRNDDSQPDYDKMRRLLAAVDYDYDSNYS
jgi:GR25 family glycosyltransferase involved in LPS biosynthesis